MACSVGYTPQLITTPDSFAAPSLIISWPFKALKHLCRWVPASERSRSLALVYSGMYSGSIMGLALSPHMVAALQWPSVFYVFGVVGIFWFLAWERNASSSPAVDDKISDSEREYITKATIKQVHSIGHQSFGTIMAYRAMVGCVYVTVQNQHMRCHSWQCSVIHMVLYNSTHSLHWHSPSHLHGRMVISTP